MTRLALLALLALAACSSLDPVTMTRLSRLDPLTADPSDVVARLALPPGLEVPPGGATLALAARRRDTGETLDAHFALIRRGDTWRLARADADRLRELQAGIRDWTSAAPDASEGSLSLRLTGCAIGTGPAPTAPVSADLSLDGGTSFAPLVRGLTAGEIAAMADPGTTGAYRPCPRP